MASKIVKIGLAVLGIIFGGFEIVDGIKDLIEVTEESTEEKVDKKVEEKVEELE